MLALVESVRTVLPYITTLKRVERRPNAALKLRPEMVSVPRVPVTRTAVTWLSGSVVSRADDLHLGDRAHVVDVPAAYQLGAQIGGSEGHGPGVAGGDAGHQTSGRRHPAPRVGVRHQVERRRVVPGGG